MTTALSLEKLMLGPGFDEAAARQHASVPAPIRDQADAAIAEARQTALAAAARIDAAPTGTASIADIPGWLRLGILDAFVQLINGTAQTCRHSPVPDNPQPVMAAAWRPGLLTCRRCVHLFTTVRGSDADRTCDGCGRVCTGVDGDLIQPGLLSMSVIVFQYGACADCLAPAKAEQGPPRRERAVPRGTRGHRRGRGRP